MTTIAEKLTALAGIKTAIATAIVNKGVAIGNAPFDQYPAKINAILSGPAPLSTAPWVRPADWLALPTVLATEEKVVGLYAVHPDSNFLAVSAAGDYTVIWGDGVAENFLGGSTAYHTYDYNNVALNGTVSSKGYKQAIVTIVPQNGHLLTTVDLSVRQTLSGFVDGDFSNWLDVTVSGQNISTLAVSGANISGCRHYLLERFNIVKLGNVTSFYNLFSNCYSLKSVKIPETGSTAAVSNFDSMFTYCINLQELPLFDTSSATTFANMFNGCTVLRTIPLFNSALVTMFQGMFTGCSMLQTIPLINTSSGDTFNNMFDSCSSLKSIPLLDVSMGTDLSWMLYYCISLTEIPLFNTAKALTVVSMLSYCSSLETIPLFNTSACNNFSSMFEGCSNLQSVPLLDTSMGTSFSNMFRLCQSLRTIPSLSTVLGQEFTSMFAQCSSLQSVPLLNTSNSIYTSMMFYGCPELSEIPALDFTNTISGQAWSIFNGCIGLSKSSVVNLKVSHSYENCKLSAERLNEIYTNLPVVIGQSLTISGNWGASTSNTAIATAKGWTIIA